MNAEVLLCVATSGDGVFGVLMGNHDDDNMVVIAQSDTLQDAVALAQENLGKMILDLNEMKH